MSLNKEEKETIIPSIEDHHYLMFNSDFNSTSSGDAISFIIARNLMTKQKPKQIKMIINSPGGEVIIMAQSYKGVKVIEVNPELVEQPAVAEVPESQPLTEAPEGTEDPVDPNRPARRKKK